MAEITQEALAKMYPSSAEGQAAAGAGAGSARATSGHDYARQGAQGGSPPEWIQSLPEAIKGDQSIRRFKDPGELASAYLEARAKLPVVPEAPDSYDLALPDDMPVDDTFVGWYQETAHKLGLTNDQAKQLAGEYRKQSQAQERLLDLEEARWERELHKELGPRFSETMNAVDRITSALEPEIPGLKRFIASFGFSKHPVMTKLLLTIGRHMQNNARGRF